MDFLFSEEVKTEFFVNRNESINKFKCGEIVYCQNNAGAWPNRTFNLQCSHCSLEFDFINFSDFIDHVNEINPLILNDEEHMDDASASVTADMVGVSFSDSDETTDAFSDTLTVNKVAEDVKPPRTKLSKTRIKLIENEQSIKSKPKKKYFKKSKTKSYQCYKCGVIFENSVDLNYHIKTKHAENTYKCNICDMTFVLPARLAKHMRTHNKSRYYRYKCDICSKQYQSLSDLKEHMCVHSGERPHKCDLCEKAFIKYSSLTRHKKVIHLKMKGSNMCNYCGKTYPYPNDLVEHIRTHTGENPFKCNYCEKAFTRSCHLKQHERTHTGEKPFKCHFCDNRYATYAGVSQHEKCMHKEEVKIWAGKLKPIRII